MTYKLDPNDPKYTYKGLTLLGMPFTSRYKYGDVVLFHPAAGITHPAVITGLIIKGPKVAYEMVLVSGAEVRTYGDRVEDFPEGAVLLEEDRKFLEECLSMTTPGL